VIISDEIQYRCQESPRPFTDAQHVQLPPLPNKNTALCWQSRPSRIQIRRPRQACIENGVPWQMRTAIQRAESDRYPCQRQPITYYSTVPYTTIYDMIITYISHLIAQNTSFNTISQCHGIPRSEYAHSLHTKGAFPSESSN
jgi:hypothetical protein